MPDQPLGLVPSARTCNATRLHLGRLVSIGAVLLTMLTAFLTTQAHALPPGFIDELITDGIAAPTAIAVAPDGRLFVTEQGGAVRVVKGGVLLSQPFVRLTVDSSGERGLLGIALHPDFATNGFVYVYHTVAGSPARNHVTRFTADGDVALAGSAVAILTLDPLSDATYHNGGAIHFSPGGKLFVAVGENTEASNAQSLNNRLGKILRINPDRTIPPDNLSTFPGIAGSTTGASRAIWAVGLRNPYHLHLYRPYPDHVHQRCGRRDLRRDQ